MYSLFTNNYAAITGVIKPPNFELVRRSYLHELDKIINYYRSRAMVVPAQHLLCRLIDVAMVPMQYDVYRYLDVVYARAPYVGKHFKMTSSITYGQPFQGVFYGPGCIEYIITEEHPINITEAVANWKSIRAVRVLEHPISDMGLLLPNGRINSTATGISVIVINIPLLMLQYRCFLESKKALATEDTVTSPQYFIQQYVLPNMLYSHADIVVFNRLENLYRGRSNSEALMKHPFAIVQHTAKLDSVLDDVLFKIENARLNYPTYLSNIPAIRMDDAREALMLPDIASTIQVWWLLMYSRIREIKFLLDVGGAKGQASNGVYMSELRMDLKALRSQRAYRKMLPTAEADMVDEFIVGILG